MRYGSDDLSGVLSGAFDHHWEADLFYDGERRLERVPFTDVRFSEDAEASIQQSGSCTVVWSDEFARSASPREVTDWFAPFGAQLAVYSVISAGPFSERVQYGWFEITGVPSAEDSAMRFRDQWITTGSRVELELKELLAGVGEERFDVPSAPKSLTSTWDELGRVTGLQLSRTITDKAITRSILYPESKLDAAYDLLSVMLDAVPHMTADGALAARPNVWPAVVDRLSQGEWGTVVRVGHEMSAAQVYNRVVVRAGSGDQVSILAVAEVTSGPLRVRNSDGSASPFRARTKYLSSELVTTPGQAQTWANSELAKVSTLRATVVPVVETFNPLRERGDVVEIEWRDRLILGRVVTIDRGDRATQQLTVEVGSTSILPFPYFEPWPPQDTGPAYLADDLFLAHDFFLV